MSWFERDKEKERYYLLPGMGGRNLAQKRKVMLFWAIITGLFTSAVVASLLYWLSQR